MILTPSNYHSSEANQHYMSVSQYKDFCGTYGRKGCEAAAIAKLKGEWKEPMSTSMLVGSYVDAWYEGSMQEFRGQHPEIFTQKGELRAEFKKAEAIVERTQKDLIFRQFMAGEKQVIMTAELFGQPWKIKIDSLHPKVAIVDLKVMKNLRDTFWVKDYGRMNFVEYWGYDLQMAIYQRVYKEVTGELLPIYIAAADKGEVTDIELITFDQMTIDNALALIEFNLPRIAMLKAGETEPVRCETCDYCKSTKILTNAIHYSELAVNV